MEFPGMTHKWSSKPKEQKAARIRDNQRRHRAKTKAYIADLERQLAEARMRLDEALVRNAGLMSELEKLRASSADKSVANGLNEMAVGQPLMRSVDAEEPVFLSNPPSTPWNGRGSPSSPLFPPTRTHTSLHTFTSIGPPAPQAALPANPISTRSKERSPLAPTKPPEDEHSYMCPRSDACGATSCPAPAAPSTVSSQDDQDLAVLQSDWSHLPPPMLGESTIPCKTAYAIIKQQNYGGLDLSAIGGFLAAGFRRATIHGDGCRVESNRVFSVIDAISSLGATSSLHDPQ